MCTTGKKDDDRGWTVDQLQGWRQQAQTKGFGFAALEDTYSATKDAERQGLLDIGATEDPEIIQEDSTCHRRQDNHLPGGLRERYSAVIRNALLLMMGKCKVCDR